jgi:hypothetical protein
VWGDACENGSSFKALVGDEGKRPLGRSRSRCVYNIKIYIKKNEKVYNGIVRLSIGNSDELPGFMKC